MAFAGKQAVSPESGGEREDGKGEEEEVGLDVVEAGVVGDGSTRPGVTVGDTGLEGEEP